MPSRGERSVTAEPLSPSVFAKVSCSWKGPLHHLLLNTRTCDFEGPTQLFFVFLSDSLPHLLPSDSVHL